MPKTRTSRSLLFRLIAVLLALAFVAAACGDDDDDGGGGNAGGNNNGGSNGGEEAKPTPGGKMIFGLEADSDGFDPTKNRFAISGHMVASAVYDSLMRIDKDRKVVPNLAKSLEPSADYKTWTLTLPPGLKFTNGQPVNADAVVLLYQKHLASPLTGFAIKPPMNGVAKVDDLTVKFTMDEPWVPFPYYLTGQTGYLPAPETLNSEDGSRHPIGTGPFIQKSWTPGQSWVGTKNPNYWKKADDGAQLPYLDQIEFRVITDDQSRYSALQRGNITATMTTSDDTIVQVRDNDKFLDIEDGVGEEFFVQLNTLVKPFNEKACREALALATDQERLIKALGHSIGEPVNSPFQKGELGYVADTGYPTYDLAAAKEKVGECEDAIGGKFSFSYGGVSGDAVGLSDQQYIQAMWREAGIDSKITLTEQSNYINVALLGNYQAVGWRQFGAPDPDVEYVWWTSKNAADVGGLALNFARNKDPKIDQALETGRTSPEESKRAEAYQTLAKQLGQDIPYIWISNTVWLLTGEDNIHGLDQIKEEGGIGNLASKPLAEVWVQK